MKKTTNKILLFFMAILLSVNVVNAESWDCKTENNVLTHEKPYIQLDMRWFEWYTSNSWMDSWKISFSDWSDVFEFTEGADLCTGSSEWASDIRDDNDTYKTYESENFFVELWDPYTEHGDKYNYRVTIRILPKFPIEKNTRIRGCVSTKWRDNHDGPYDRSHNFVATVDDEYLFQTLGTLTRDSNRIKYTNDDLADISGKYDAYTRKLSISTDTKEETFTIPKESTSFSKDVSLSSNRQAYSVTQTISMENASFSLGDKTHKVSFIVKETKSFKGSSYPNAISTEPYKWSKSIKVKWTAESKDLSTAGKWRVIRKNVETGEEVTVASGLDFGTTSYSDNSVEYDTKYLYTVVFTPDGWDNTVCSDLSKTSGEVEMKKDFKITLNLTPSEDYILLSWEHEALSGSGNYSYKVLKSVNNDSTWSVLKTEGNLSSNVTKYSYKDMNIGSSCDINYYKIEMVALNNEVFSSENENGKILGSTVVTNFNASRGDYSGNVKLTWNVDQVGSDRTKFKLYRQLLGSDSSNEWKMVHETEGVSSVYTYDDITANIGQYYRYKLVASTSCDGGYDSGMNYYSDGFCLATGVISGRVTYGTGTAVEGVKVSAQKAFDDDNSNEQFYSLNVNDVGGVVTSMKNETAKTIFGNSFSIQAWVNLDTISESNQKIVEPVITQMYNMFKLTAKRYGGGFKLNVNTFDADNGEKKDYLTDIVISADRFYHLTLSYNHKIKGFVLYSIDNEREIEIDTIIVNEKLDVSKSVIDTAKMPKAQVEYFRDFHGQSPIAFAACMEDSTNHYYKGYIDDIRVWNKFLALEEIKKNYDHLLAGTEKGLRIYYPLDEGIRDQERAYDYSKTDGVPNSLHGIIVTGTAVSNEYSSLLGLHAYTDTLGNYTIRGVPFRGTGTSYNVIPTYGIHEFSPSADSRYVSSSSLNFSGVNFEDISSFPVSGVVYYENTTYPVAGASLYVDNVLAVKDGKPVVTNVNGEYTISVPIGDHYITVKRDRHTFVNGGRYPNDPNNVGTKFTFDREIKDLTFYDNTKAVYAGRVTGGNIEHGKPLGGGASKANIGQAKIVFSAPYKMNVKRVSEGGAVRYVTNSDTLHYKSDSIAYVNSRAFTGNTEESVYSVTILTDPKTGEFAVELPPVEYNVDSAVVLTNDKIIFPELPTFIKPSNELVDYRDTSNVVVSLRTDERVAYVNDTIITCDTIVVDSVSGIYSVVTDTMVKVDTVYMDSAAFEQRVFKYNASLFLTHYSEPVFEVTEHGNGIFGVDTAYCVEADGTKTPVQIYDVDKATNKVKYIYDYPMYELGEPYSYDIRAYEEYVNFDGEEPVYARVPLAGTTVNIQNEFAAGNTISTRGDNDGEIVDLVINELKLDSVGYARYEFRGGAPNIVEPYTLSLNMSYVVNGRHYDWERNGDFKAIILGDLPTGNNFITQGPEQVQMILRDPPGSQSYSYWETGTTHTTTTQLGGHYVGGGELKVNIGLGKNASFATGGPGFYKIGGIDIVRQHIPGIDIKLNIVDKNTTTTVSTTTERISTSSDPNFVGAEGDVFIGSSTNIVFADSREVGFHRDKNTNKIVLNMEDCTAVNSEFTTGFKYTQYYIENILFPNTLKLRNETLLPVGTNIIPKNDTIYYVSKLETGHEYYGTSNSDSDVWGEKAKTESVEENGYTRIKGESYDILYDHTYYSETLNSSAAGLIQLPQDQVNYYNESIDNWKKILKMNEKAKIDAKGDADVENISIDGGAVYENRYTTEDRDEDMTSIDFTVDLFVDHAFGAREGSADKDGNGGSGIVVNHGISFGGGGNFDVGDSDNDIKTKGYVIQDSEFDNALSVDISEDNFGAIFRTRGGQTSCPYEGAVKSKYEQPGTVLSEATMRIEYPQITADIMTLSNVPSGSAAVFDVKLSNLSESDTDVWYVLGVVDDSNPHGAMITIDGLGVAMGRSIFIEADSTLTKQLIIKQSDPSILDYENLQITFASGCQNDPASVYGAVADTLNLSVHFVPSCSPIELHIDNRVVNAKSNKLTMRVDGYDLNYRSLKGINIQIKGERDNNWTTLKSYVKDTAYVTQDVELLNSNEIIYTNALTNFSDQNYLVRAITLCEYGSETINNESEEILITKDLLAPALIANPNPADGVLSSGDEVSILFNENIKQGEINEVDNIYVKGILNGSELAHAVAYATNENNPAKTEAVIDLNKRPFTVEMWIKYSSEGVILTHGASDNAFVIDVDAEGKLGISTNGSNIKSEKIMPKDTWIYLSVAVSQKEEKSSVSAVCAYDGKNVEMFVDEMIQPYTGKGTLALGYSVDAAIHELTLWDYARTSIESMSNIYTSKSPYTTGLVGYWKLNEGHGTIGNDYVRNRHLNIAGNNSWYLENENKALELKADGFVTMNVSHCPTNVDENYLLEFWFKAEKQNAGVTLVSMCNDNDSLFVRLDENGYVKTEINQNMLYGPDVNYLDNTWHHVAINVLKANHSTAIIYIDGDNVIQTTADAFPAVQTNNLIFGGEGSADSELSLDEIRYWKGTYTSDYIRNNMYSRVTAGEPGLMAYYPMEQVSVDEYNQVVYTPTLNDQSGNDALEDIALKVYEMGTESYWTDNTPPLKVAPIYDNVDVSYVASERKLLLNIDEDPRIIEGCTLIFTVSGLKDANDNMMNPVTWSTYVRQNQLNWDKSSVDIRKHSGEKEYFSAKILNTSGNTEYWSLQNIPSWIEADVESGELAPLSETTINFTISDATSIGNHEAVLYLSGNNAIPEPMIVKLVCEGDVPEWNVNVEDFSATMNMIAQLKINGLLSNNPDDVVAAFVGDMCVGKASPTYNKHYDTYYVMMSIYGNKADTISFKVYDASTGNVYPIVKADPSVVYCDNSVAGDLNNPIVLSSVDELQQTIQLNKGWSWISFNVIPENNSFDNVMKSVAENVSYVKTKKAQGVFNEKTGTWQGTLTSVSYSEMYKVQSDAKVAFDVVGKLVNVKDAPIDIYNGWNWIGYNSATILSVTDALAGVNPVDGDLIKNRNEFATFDGYEWIGNLTHMQPGQGYIYKSNDKNKKSFTYPSATRSSRGSEDNQLNDNTPSFAYDYQNNMNVIVQVKDGDVVVDNATIEVFAGNSLRGVSAQAVVDGKHFLTIHGDSSDERVSFIVTIEGNTYEVVNALGFSEDAVVGTLYDPYVIQIRSCNAENDVTVYPTLAKDVVNVSSKENMSTIDIHNVSGLKVYHDEECGESKQINIETLNSGVYVVTVTTEDGDVSVTYIVKY